MDRVPDHPDIRAAERTGYPQRYSDIYEEDDKNFMGECRQCGDSVYADGGYVESFDGVFCDMECCHEYYEIKEVS